MSSISGIVSLFNGISTVVIYIIPKSSLLKNNNDFGWVWFGFMAHQP